MGSVTGDKVKTLCKGQGYITHVSCLLTAVECSTVLNANWTVFAASVLLIQDSRWWSGLPPHCVPIHDPLLLSNNRCCSTGWCQWCGGRLKELIMFRCPRWVERKVLHLGLLRHRTRCQKTNPRHKKLLDIRNINSWPSSTKSYQQRIDRIAISGSDRVPVASV